MRTISWLRRHSLITTLILSVCTYAMCVIFSAVIEPLLRSAGVRFDGIVPPGGLLALLWLYFFFAVNAVLLGVFVPKLRYVPIYYAALFACIIAYCPDRFYKYDRRSGFCRSVESIFGDGTLLSAAVISIAYILVIQFIPYVLSFIITKVARKNK